jgi:chaperone required for assembly of F1-ATPase
MKRFYKDVTVSAEDNAPNVYILLDGKTVKTPAKHDFTCGSLALAELAAQEWRDQSDTIDPNSMPITQLISTSIDRVSFERISIEADLIGYLETDLLLFWADQPKELNEKQQKLWQPLIEYCANEKGPLPHPTTSFSSTPVIAETVHNWEAFLKNLSAIELTIVAQLTGLSGSILLAYNYYSSNINAEEFQNACFCEEFFYVDLYDTKHNGLDPQLQKKIEGMDLDLAAISALLPTITPTTT